MKRRDTISILEDILKVLRKNKELSFNQLQRKTRTQWRTLKRCLEFLMKENLVSERKTGKNRNSTRLFFIK